jgi:hypothetical protein
MTKAQAAIEKLFPVGYQDETGFHYGTKPPVDDSSWPSI